MRRWNKIPKVWDQTGLDYLRLSVFRLGNGAFSSVRFHRRQGRPNVSARDKNIVEIMLRQVDWLHRQQADEFVNESVVGHSLRQRQVLTML